MPASKKPKIEKTCRHCKKVFLSNNTRQISCSQSCTTYFNRKQNPAKHAENARKYYKTLNRDRRKHRALNDNYGISLEIYNKMSADQQFCCKICNQKFKLHVDHDHESGQVRDLLCNGCNRGLGFFSENIDALKQAVLYLERWQK